MKSNDLRKLIKSKLDKITGLKATYYISADDNALYPHVVFGFGKINLGDLNRDDLILNIDLWGNKSVSAVDIENLMDSIESEFDNHNEPQATILPTFYVTNRGYVTDEDKNIKHRYLEVQVQNYEK